MNGPFQLANLIVRPELNLIERGQDTFHLEPRIMDLLCLLADRAGGVVSRDDILEALWADRFGADASLTRAISLLRKTFRDAGIDEELIVTVPKRGYRLAQSPTPAVDRAVASDRTAKPMPGRPVLFGVLATTLLIAVLAWALWPTSEPKTSSSDDDRNLATGEAAPEQEQPVRRSVAVLPLVNRSEAEDAYLTDALHDEILAQLARFGSMKVISRTSVTRFRETDLPASAIASQLGVRHLVEGGVLRSGNRIRVTVQLIDAHTDEHLWAEVYDRELTADSLFAIQGDIAIAIASTLQAQLSTAERERVGHRPTDNFAAYQAVLLGRQAFLRRNSDRVPALERALEHFDRALTLEPDYAEALAGKAAVYAVWAGYQSGDPDGRTRELSIDHARQALAIDPLLSLPHAVLGLVAESATERFHHLDRAVTLAPSDATARLWAGINDLLSGYLARGEERLEQARELDPTYPIATQWLAVAADLRGDRERTLAFLEQGVAMGMSSASGLASTLSYRGGEAEKTKELFRVAVPLAELDAWVEDLVGIDDGPAARDRAVRTILGPENGNSIPHYRILMLAAIGAHDAALDLIEQRLPVDMTAFVYAWRQDDEELRRHPKFKVLARSLGLPEYWRQAGFPPGCQPAGGDDFHC